MAESMKEQANKYLVQLENERSTWEPQLREVGDYIVPNRVRWSETDRNKGGKKRGKIINSHATRSAKNLGAGMMSGITSPARPWFKLETPDADLMEYGPVKEWLNEVEKRMQKVFNKSNIYQIFPTLYLDQGAFGLSCMGLFDDREDVIRCYEYPTGSYYISTNNRRLVDGFAMKINKTVRQVVTEYGLENVSITTKNLWDRGSYEQYIPVRHVIMLNPNHDPARLASKYLPYLSLHYETSVDSENQFLRQSGFHEFPIHATRWDKTANDAYGEGPGIEAMGDIKAMQLLEKRKSQAIEKIINPPMKGPTNLRQANASTVPGHITYYNPSANEKEGFTPVYQINFSIKETADEIREHEKRISRAFYEDLFLMLAQSDRRQITAREVAERHEEKMLVLGPVLENENEELLDPVIDRTFNIMLRRGMIPEPPPELQDVDLNVEYISILHQAQKLVATAGVERFAAFAGSLAAVNQEVLDKVDFDQTIDEYADMTGVPPKIIRTDEEVAAIRQQRAAQLAQQRQQELAAQAVQGAKVLSETDTQNKNALTDILGTGGSAG